MCGLTLKTPNAFGVKMSGLAAYVLASRSEIAIHLKEWLCCPVTALDRQPKSGQRWIAAFIPRNTAALFGLRLPDHEIVEFLSSSGDGESNHGRVINETEEWNFIRNQIEWVNEVTQRGHNRQERVF